METIHRVAKQAGKSRGAAQKYSPSVSCSLRQRSFGRAQVLYAGYDFPVGVVYFGVVE